MLFDELLENNMTDEGYIFWTKLKNIIPDAWNKPTSSSGKYHRDENGNVQTTEEHTCEMINACVNLFEIFNVKPKSKDADLLLLGVTLHDSAKYGKDPINKRHTCRNHDRIIGDLIALGRTTFLKHFDSTQVYILEEMCRFHSGRFSTDADKDFSWERYNRYTLFLHFLDMCSSKRLFKNIIKKDNIIELKLKDNNDLQKQMASS